MSQLPSLAQGAGGGPAPFYANPIVLFALIAVIWWFLLIRPQRLQEKKHRAMLDSLKTGDKVVTTGGLYGAIAQVGDRTLKLKVADNVKVEIARSAVAAMQSSEESAPGDRPKES